ncbi:MAG: hypothetical protein LUH14_02255 [Clostridiaceae bacterium]|nr:hypothetical protein [Clostridiaceae bacterium]
MSKNISAVKNPEKPVKLILNGADITSLKDLRENVNTDEMLNYFISKDLQLWLTQHYYDNEAAAIEKLSIDTPNCLQKICKILGIAYSSAQKLSQEEMAKLDAKKKVIQSFTTDPHILSEIDLVAMSQEELASLLSRGEKTIYLCNNTFSLPLRVPNVTYTGIGNVTVESPFTEKQYARAGIKINGVNLPTDTDSETDSIALEIAMSNGYDAFEEKHTPFSTPFYHKIKGIKYFNMYHLSFNSTAASKFFTSKHECEQTRDQIIRKAYNDAARYLSTGSSKSISKEAAQTYSALIANVFSADVLNQLKSLSNITHTSSTYKKLENLVSKCYKNLLSQFENELNESRDYYALYDFNYFINQADIEEHDYRISEEGFLHILETVFTDSIQYTISSLFDVINEIENDLNDHAATFFNTAAAIYSDYYTEIIELLDVIGKELDAIKEQESLVDYLTRMCVSKVS